MPVGSPEFRTTAKTKHWSRVDSRAFLVIAVAAVSLYWSAAGSARAEQQTGAGNSVYSQTDIATYDPSDSKADPGAGLAFVRSYDSLNTRVSTLGLGWTHSYDMHLSYVEDTKNVILTGPQGRTNRYTSYPGGRYDPEPEATSLARLVKNLETETYTATYEDGMVWRFNTQGRLTAIADTRGHQTTLKYNAGGQLTSVSDQLGRQLNLAYDSVTGLVTRVSDGARTVTYAYDRQSHLIKVTDIEGGITQLAYDDSTQRLATITDPLGNVATVHYDDQGPVVSGEAG